MAGFIDRDAASNRGFLNTIQSRLKDLVNFGVRYEDKLIKNSMALGAQEEQYMRKGGIGGADDAGLYSMAMADFGSKKAEVYASKEYKERRAFLRTFSLNGEIQWILDTITDECIVQDDRQMFCYPVPLSDDLQDDVKNKYDEFFKRIYTLFRFNDDITAWQFMQKLLIDGLLAFEIVWDDKAKNIIGFKELDPVSLREIPEKSVDGKYEHVWYQNYDDVQLRRRLLDNQIIYLSYAKDNFSMVSYTDRLVRSFNLLRIMEHTRVIWAIMNSTYRMKMVVPIGSKSEIKAKQALGEIASTYKEDVSLNYDTGEMTYNGKPHIPFFRNYVYPNKNGESVEMSTLAYDGPDMSDMTQLDYFYNKLKLDSKIPAGRFDRLGGGGGFAFGTDGMDREEVRFSRFINRHRSMFQEILQKPLYLQMVREFPELGTDVDFKGQIGIRFNKENQYERIKEMEVLGKTADFIGSVMSINTIRDGQEAPFFHPMFLIKRWMPLSHEELQENEELWKKYGTSSPIGDMGFQASGFGDNAGGGDDFGGDEPTEDLGPAEDLGGDEDLGGEENLGEIPPTEDLGPEQPEV